jgi:hypothetical protein
MTFASTACTQLSLELFPPPSFETIISSRRIAGLSVKIGKRLRRGWYVKMNMHSNTRCLVVPFGLENAPAEVKTAVIDWALLLDNSRRRNRCPAKKKELERLIFRFMESSGMAAPRGSRFHPASFATAGRLYDLAEVFHTLNTAYFNGELASYVRWGKNPLRSYQSVKYAKNGNRFNLITIGRMYDRSDVPRHAVEGIMFHEMLHIAVPPAKSATRNIIHGAEFKRRERLFPYHAQWLAWEKTALQHIA